MNSDEKNLKEQWTIKSVLTSEVKFVIGVVTIALGLVAPYYSQKQDIALIQKDIAIINTNHEAHIQDITKNIEEIKLEQVEQNKQIIENQQQIIILLNKK